MSDCFSFGALDLILCQITFILIRKYERERKGGREGEKERESLFVWFLNVLVNYWVISQTGP